MYPHESLPIASQASHNHLCSLINNTQQANSYNIFEDFDGCPFSFPKHTWTWTKKDSPPFNSTCCFYLLSRACDPNFTRPHKSTLCPMLANHIILRAQVAPNQLHHFRLLFVPSTFVHMCILTIACPIASLTDSQHTAGKHPSLPSRCPFSPRNRPCTETEKGALCIRLPVSTPYRGGCDVNFTPCKYSLPDIAQSLHLARQSLWPGLP